MVIVTSSSDPLGRIPKLYHFTDKRNLPSIRQSLGLLPLAVLNKDGVHVPAPGGNQWSHDADRRGGLDRYVHLCFRDQHPMEFQAKKEGRIVDSIFLQISPDILKAPGVLFTPDISNKSGVKSYPLEQAIPMIDFEVLYTRTNWQDPAIQMRLQTVQKYEILVPNGVPLAMIRNFPNG